MYILDHDEKKLYDDGSMKGMEKMFETLRTSTDWMFMKSFLTNDLVRELDLYLYIKQSNPFFEELVITDKKAEEIKDIIIKSFSHSGIPKILVTNGDYFERGELLLEHEYIGIDLDSEYAKKTLDHIAFLWNDTVHLKTYKNKTPFKYIAKPKKNEIELSNESSKSSSPAS